MIRSINPFASATPALNQGPRKKEQIDIQIGASNFWVDGIRNVLSIRSKILFLNSKINSGNVSKETIGKMRDFLHENGLHDVSVSVNQYKPQEVWRRTFTNPKTSLLSKCTAGVVFGLLETLLIPKLSGIACDHYNPYSNTVHLFSDDLATALHECGHAKDVNERANPGLYGAIALINYTSDDEDWANHPIFFAVLKSVSVGQSCLTLYQEYKATDNAIAHLRVKNLNVELKRSFKVLVPSFAAYCANAVLTKTNTTIKISEWLKISVPNISFIGFMVAGHIIGQILAAYKAPQNKPEQRLAAVPATA